MIGHDRGALVAFRAALDHPDVIRHLGVLDIIPTVDNWRALTGPAGVFAFHLYLLAQPGDLPERVIGADPDLFFAHFLDTWVADPTAIPADARAAYLAACRTPEVIHAICQDYRASAFVDAAHDEQDQQAGRRLGMPVLAMWQDPGDTPLPFDPQQVWSSWEPDLRTQILDCGHFLPEERPVEVAAAGFVLAGVGFIADQAWWAGIGIGAGAVGLLLMTMFFNPWLLVGIAISAAILYAGVQALPQA